jgi:RHS repeat-associated protein
MTKTTDYVGNKVYENNTLKRILVNGGYIENGVYHYYLTDHLGNNRIVAKQDGVPVQKTHYYPFGSSFAVTTGAGIQPYKYNNKELDQMHGLNLYDYSARYYEPAIGRFTTVDPLAEKYYSISPYAYVANNPINAVDLRGDTITTIIDGSKYTWGNVDGKYGFVGSDGALYSGKDKFANSLTKALNTLRSKDAGRELVDYLAGDAGSVNIVDNNSNSADIGTGKTIKWGDSNNNPGAPRPGFIGLGHEMAHIQDKWKGTLDMTPWATVTDAAGNNKTIYNAEKHALHIENQIRAEHGKSLRTHYAYDLNGNGVNSTSFIQNGASMFHNRGSLHTTAIVNGTPVVTISRIPFKY